ncbi:MAG: YlxR family protein [Candidatus Dormibacterales bacterium]
MCVGCRGRAPKEELMRLVQAGAEVVLDASGKAPGRGAYLHPRSECAGLARRRRALERALGGSAGPSTWDDIITNSAP